MKARFRVVGTFDLAGGAQEATIEVERETGIISVRPLRRRRVYALPLAAVAAMICRAIIAAEHRERKAARRSRRRSR